MSYKKDAVNIGITLSTQLIAAALAMITIVGTFAAFIIEKKSVNDLYYITTIIAFLLFISSIICGGKGIDKARKNGFTDNWNLSDTKPFFNYQAILCLFGIVFFMVSIFLGKEKKDNSLKKNETLEKKIKKLELNDSINHVNMLLNIKKIEELNLRIDHIEKKINKRKSQKKNINKNCCKTIIQNFNSISTLNNNVQ